MPGERAVAVHALAAAGLNLFLDRDLGGHLARLLLADVDAARARAAARRSTPGWCSAHGARRTGGASSACDAAFAIHAGVWVVLLRVPDRRLGGRRRRLLLARVAAARRGARARRSRRGAAVAQPPDTSVLSGADLDARDHPRRRRRRAGGRAAPHRARPPRRRPGAARRARHEPRHGRAEARDASRRCAAELLADARAGAARRSRELRDLARGIHPPVLADRGLEAAVRAARGRSPISVTVSATVVGAPAAAGRERRLLRRRRGARQRRQARARRARRRADRAGRRDRCRVEVARRRRRRRRPLGRRAERPAPPRARRSTGRSRSISPPGGPTTIRAELPCGS